MDSGGFNRLRKAGLSTPLPTPTNYSKPYSPVDNFKIYNKIHHTTTGFYMVKPFFDDTNRILLVVFNDKLVHLDQVFMNNRGQGRKGPFEVYTFSPEFNNNIMGHHINMLLHDKGGGVILPILIFPWFLRLILTTLSELSSY